MHLITLSRHAALSAVLVSVCSCSSLAQSPDPGDSNVRQDTQAAGPLAGTGIEPNVVAYSPQEFNDPFIGLNRAVFAFNDVSYRYVLIPAARLYVNNTPAPVQTGIGNFFSNIKAPISMVNHLLQLQPEAAGVDLLRFAINSTVGLLGILDPAEERFDLPPAETDMSATLESYGTGYGAYLVLPFIGPSNLRDGSATLIDGYLNPLRYLLDNPESAAVRVFDNFQEFAPAAEGYLTLHAESEDPYIFMRNLHLQGLLRDAQYKTPN